MDKKQLSPNHISFFGTSWAHLVWRPSTLYTTLHPVSKDKFSQQIFYKDQGEVERPLSGQPAGFSRLLVALFRSRYIISCLYTLHITQCVIWYPLHSNWQCSYGRSQCQRHSALTRKRVLNKCPLHLKPILCCFYVGDTSLIFNNISYRNIDVQCSRLK